MKPFLSSNFTSQTQFQLNIYRIFNISRRSFNKEHSSEDPDQGSKRRSVSTSRQKRFSIFGRRRNVSSTSCRSTEFESLDEDTASGSEGLLHWGSRSRNQSCSSRGSRIRSLQHQSTGSCDSGVFGDSSKSYRILFLGLAGVGKTSIVSQFLHKQFSTRYKPTLQEMYSGEIDLGGSLCILNIEDTGQNFVHEFPAMVEVSLRVADGVVLVFSVDDPRTFEEVS